MASLETAIYITVMTFLCGSIFYLSYSIILRLSVRKSRSVSTSKCVRNDLSLPRVSMIVPTYNEEKIILRKIINTRELDYPKDRLEVLFVDGCSTDGTGDIIVEHVDLTNMRLLKQNRRMGFNAGVFEGVANANVGPDEIIVLSAADAIYSPQAIRNLCRHFFDLQVGAVTGREIVINKDESLATKIESMYRELQDTMSEAEMVLDSPFDIKGEICAARRVVLDSLRLRQDPRRGSVDCCISSEARRLGYRVIYDGEATYGEYAPSKLRERMRMQVRRAKILIESLLMYRDMIFRHEYGAYGQVILPAHFIMLIVVPWLFLTGIVSFLISTWFHPMLLVGIGVVILIFFVLQKIGMFALGFSQSQLSLILGVLTILARKETVIRQIETTRR